VQVPLGGVAQSICPAGDEEDSNAQLLRALEQA
jgi:hypothetical protein